MGLGVLIVDGLRLSEVVRVAERYGARVLHAREGADGAAVLDVSMDTPAANAVALALLDVPVRYLPTSEYERLAS